MPRLPVGLALALLMLAGPAGAENLGGLAGDWRTVRHGAHVVIGDCGDGTPCGHLVAIDPAVGGGRTHDDKNHDPALRGRPLDGLPILWGYAFEDGRWREGRLYNPDTGQTFRSTLDLVDPDRLRVTGCWGPFCRTQTWTRIEPRTSTNARETTHD